MVAQNCLISNTSNTDEYNPFIYFKQHHITPPKKIKETENTDKNKDVIKSCGVICFRRNQKTGKFEFLLIGRSISLNFSEFITGKYDTTNNEYIKYMLRNMTEQERSILKFSRTFRELATNVNRIKNINIGRFNRDSYDQLKRTVLDQLLDETSSEIDEPEWGFPKGRYKNNHESDYTCAIREFEEETGIQSHVLTPYFAKPYEETFQGSNNKKYKHVYYVLECTSVFDENQLIKKCDKKEVGNIKWKTKDEALECIKDTNPERRSLFKNVCLDINNTYLPNKNYISNVLKNSYEQSGRSKHIFCTNPDFYYRNYI